MTYPTVNILTERNKNMPYFIMDELFIEATEGQYKGTTPWYRWHASIDKRKLNGCHRWKANKITTSVDFYITCREDTRTNEQFHNGKFIHPFRMAWLLYIGEIKGCIDAVHNNAIITNCCETADEPLDVRGCKQICVNPHHMALKRYQHWNQREQHWEIIG